MAITGGHCHCHCMRGKVVQGPRARGEGDTAGQECRASQAVAHAYTLTYIHPRTCVQSVLHGLALYATTHRTPHAAQHTLASFVLSPSHHPLLLSRDEPHSPLACRPVIYIHLMYTLLTGPMF